MKIARPLRPSPLLYAALLAACTVSSFAVAAPAATRYTMTIQFPPGRNAIAPLALNNHRQVVGARIDVDPRSSVSSIWDGETAAWHPFGNPGSVPIAINDAGKIAGRSLLSPDQRASQRAVVWCGTTMTYLRTLGGDYGEAAAINRAGDVAGYSTVGAERHAALWKGDKVIDLGTLGNVVSEAKGMNNNGEVVGWGLTAAGVHSAFHWKAGKIRNLGTLGGTYSEALAVNDKGRIVGWSYVAGSTRSRPVMWVNGKIKDLGTLGGDGGSARAINRSGIIVGDSVDAQGRGRATLWDGARIVDLNTVLDGDTTGINIGGAKAINDNGEILVSATGPHGFTDMLLTPTKRQLK